MSRYGPTKYAPFLLISAAVIIITAIVATDTSYSKLKDMRQTLTAEREKTKDTLKEIDDLKTSLKRLKTDDRFLELTARNELGLARENELVFLFPEDKNK